MSFLFSKKTRVPSIDIDHEMDQEHVEEQKPSTNKTIRNRSKSAEKQESATSNGSPNSSWGILGKARSNSTKKVPSDNQADLFHRTEQELEKEHSQGHSMEHNKEKGKIGEYEDEHDEDEKSKKAPKRKFSLRKRDSELLSDN